MCYKQWKNDFISEIQKFKSQITTNLPSPIDKLKFLSHTTTRLSEKIADNSVDCIITSPPYCTRLDYIIMTLPELLVMGYSLEQISKLRKKVTGTPNSSNKKFTLNDIYIMPQNIQDILKKVYFHPSKASNTYYFSSLISYFKDITHSISELSRIIKNDGVLHLVIQNSQYKEIHIDIASIIEKLLEDNGFIINPSNKKIYLGKGLNYIRGNNNINEVIFICKKKIIL